MSLRILSVFAGLGFLAACSAGKMHQIDSGTGLVAETRMQAISKDATSGSQGSGQNLSDYQFEASFPGGDLIGVSHVGHQGKLDRQTFDFGVASLLRLNIRSAFFYLTPEYRSKYAHQDFGNANPRTLTQLAALAPYQRAFAPFANIVLTCTTDSFSTIGLNIRDHYLTDAEYEANRKEFFDLTTYLMQTYKGTGKRFILKNWEGDWLILNGYDENADVPDSRVTNFVRWFRSTQEGIAQARNLAASSSDVKVDFALEMNRLETVQQGKRNTILGSVIPQVPSDWVAYSAWETISNRGKSQDPQAIYNTIVSDLADIKRRSGRPLFISEFGYPESEPGMQGARVEAAVRAFKDAGIPLAFYWNVYEEPYGLFRLDGQRTPNEAFYSLRKEAMVAQVSDSNYFSSPEAMNVTAAYWLVLGRKPAWDEFSYWFKNPASKNAALIHRYFAQSEEADRLVEQTFQEYAGYSPDAATRRSLLDTLAGGKSIHDIASMLYLDKLEGRLVPVATPQPTATPQPPVPQGCIGSVLRPGMSLKIGQWLCSTDGRFLLSMQRDGNLVIYQNDKPLWASNTGGADITSAEFQTDGNFVIYSGSRSIWSTKTGGTNANWLVMQNDGNLVMYLNGRAIWASNTGGR
jgi:hypothetical protein